MDMLLSFGICVDWMRQEMCVQFWPDQKIGTVEYKPVEVNYSDTVPMKDCDKILLDVFDSGKVCLTSVVAELKYFLAHDHQPQWN